MGAICGSLLLFRISRVCILVCHEVRYQMPLKNQVLPHQFACFGRMIVVDRLKSQSVVSHMNILI